MSAAERQVQMNVHALATASFAATIAVGCSGPSREQAAREPVTREPAAAPCPAVAGASESVHLKPLRPGEPMAAALPEHWKLEREDAASGVRAIILMWPGNALGLVVTTDDPRRCVLGTWALAFGGNGVTLTDWRMQRDATDGHVHMHMSYYGTYHIPEGADPEEPGTAELRTDGTRAEMVRTTGYAVFE